MPLPFFRWLHPIELFSNCNYINNIKHIGLFLTPALKNEFKQLIFEKLDNHSDNTSLKDPRSTKLMTAALLIDV